MSDLPMMRAALCERYGDASAVHVAAVPRPVPGAGEVLVRILASTLDSADRRVRALDMPPGFGPMARLAFGFRRPRQPILGTALAGIVEAVGPGVTRFRPGDDVVASTGAAQGCHAGYRVIAERKAIAAKPESLGFEEAAAVIFGGMTARFFLETKAPVISGEKVLVIGAGGAVGVAVMQLARAAGATVTACCSAGKANWVQSQGADGVIDYRAPGWPQTHEGAFDLVIDTVGAMPASQSVRLARPGGRLVALTASLWDFMAMPWLNARSGRSVIGGMVPDNAEGLARVMALAEAGRLRPAIGARFPLERIGEAHALIDGGHKTGSIVITTG
ncbi:MAG: NAD(P)-dependent alcohol dehydrogenase [Beijerinckiaceae bacterium]|nr:NAD(P)-dependent alcohol dehydrogenase [Beijerinckiaceae bacterium]MCZ8301463.1 NAD(P)-dependent alcohol dehydrogenase [Beijerinckiaceae bacterium]